MINGINLLFPVLNEHLRLENGIEKAHEYCEKNLSIPYKMTIIDNGSDDDTPEIAKKLEAKYKEVEYVRIEERGVGIAYKTGIERNEYDIVGYMDIDLSTDISYLNKMLEAFEKDPELEYVNGSRFSKDSDTKGRKWYRKITSMGLVILLKTVLKMKSSDAVCGFTFTRKETAEKLVKECGPEKGWFYTIEFLLRAERAGMKIYDMPVEWTEDYNTTVKIWKTIKNYLVNINRLHKTFKQEDKLNVKKN
ncbi:MAG: glycosyltransferase [Lachnospiraceae bacterium]|nr:glycosyltransferase [Lachnospiraceae bacterium]